ncbi:hypothetical protein ACP70R_032514 [Stipagrostis hirtigluma subsp. patula]
MRQGRSSSCRRRGCRCRGRRSARRIVQRLELSVFLVSIFVFLPETTFSFRHL